MVLQLVYKEPSFLASQTAISPSTGLYITPERLFQNEINSQSLCHPSGSHPSLGGWSLPSTRQQRSVDTILFTELLAENFWQGFSQSTANQQNQVYRYIVKWCSLCFLAETEMDAIERVLNQADTSSSKNF